MISWKKLISPPGKAPKDIKEWLGLITDTIKKLKGSENWYDDVTLLTSDNIINDLDTGGADKMLSSEQGKILNQKVNNIGIQLNKKANLDDIIYNPDTPLVSEMGFCFKKRDRYTAWTWNNVLYDKENDEVVLIYHSKENHGGAGGELLMRKIKDFSFSEPIIIASVSGRGCVTSGSQILHDSTYAMIVKETEGGVNSTVGVFFYRSTDKGLTWSKNEVLIDGNTITPRDINDCYQLKSGRILTNCTLLDGNVYTLYSDDLGYTWKKTLMQNNSGKVDPLEGKYLQLKNGCIINIMRASMSAISNGYFGFAEPALFSKSYDNGITWTPLVQSKSILDMSANNCAFIANENTIEAIYCSRFRADGSNASVYRAVASYKDAENDNFSEPIKIANGSYTGSGDFGYPGACKTNDGIKYVFYYDYDSFDGGTNIKYIVMKEREVGNKLVKYFENKEENIFKTDMQIYKSLDNLKASYDNINNYPFYIYNKGNENILLKEGYKENGGGRVTKESDYLYLIATHNNTNSCRVSFITSSAIDFSSVNKVYVDVDIKSVSGDGSFGVMFYNKSNPTTSGDGRVYAKFVNKIGVNTIEMDTTNINGSLYIAFVAITNNDSTTDTIVKCKSILMDYNVEGMLNYLIDDKPKLLHNVIYHEGNMRNRYTNGLESVRIAGYGAVNFNEDNIYMTADSSLESRRGVTTVKPIDLTNVNYIYAVVDINNLDGDGSVGLCIYKNKFSTRLKADFFRTIAKNQVIKLDVTELIGEAYPVLLAITNGSSVFTELICYEIGYN